MAFVSGGRFDGGDRLVRAVDGRHGRRRTSSAGQVDTPARKPRCTGEENNVSTAACSTAHTYGTGVLADTRPQPTRLPDRGSERADGATLAERMVSPTPETDPGGTAQGVNLREALAARVPGPARPARRS